MVANYLNKKPNYAFGGDTTPGTNDQEMFTPVIKKDATAPKGGVKENFENLTVEVGFFGIITLLLMGLALILIMVLT